MTDFEWTTERSRAAELVAAGELSMFLVASDVGVTERTIYNWLNDPAFAARVDELTVEQIVSLRRRAITHRERRVDRLNRDWLKLQRVIDERAGDARLARVPGGPTGMIVHNVKGVGKGDDFQLIDLYEIDTGLLKELREIEKQAAQELGQWVDKLDQTSGGQPLTIAYVNDWRPPRPDDPPALPAPGPAGGEDAGEAV